jgi:maltoporin
VVGIGKLVVAKSFMSYIFALTPTLLYGSYNPLYPSTSPPTSSLPNTNSSIAGNIYWLAGAIIWVGMTFSQRYDRKMPQLYDFFYYLVGIHLFYIGIASSLSLYNLTYYGHF